MICLLEIGNLKALIRNVGSFINCGSFDLGLNANTIYTSCWNLKIYKRGEFLEKDEFQNKIELSAKT